MYLLRNHLPPGFDILAILRSRGQNLTELLRALIDLPIPFLPCEHVPSVAPK